MAIIFDDNTLRIVARAPQPRTSIVVTDQDLRVIYIDAGYHDLYGFKEHTPSDFLPDLIRERSRQGWTSTSDVLLSSDPVATRLSELNSTDFLRSFQVSTDGNIVSLTHFRDHAQNRLFIVVSETQMRFEPVKESFRPQLPSCLLLLSMSDQYQELLGSQSDIPVSARKDVTTLTTAIFSNEGNLLSMHFPNAERRTKYDVKTLSDLDLSLKTVSAVLDAGDTYVAASKAIFADIDAVVRISRGSTFKGGPTFLDCVVEELGARLSVERIQAILPDLTRRELQVVSLLAQGLTLKEVAQETGRAQGTVTIQARSAVQKTGSKSVVSLVSLVCQLALLQRETYFKKPAQ